MPSERSIEMLRRFISLISIFILLSLLTGCFITKFPGMSGFVTLSQAASRGNLNRVKEIIDSGVDLNQNSLGYDAIRKASKEGHIEIVRLLIEKGVKLEPASSNRSTPLMIAAEKGYIEIARLLIDKGANSNVQDSDGRTALFYATKMNQLRIVRLLLERGIDTESVGKTDVDINGKSVDFRGTPLELAHKKGYLSIVKLLEQAERERNNKEPVSFQNSETSRAITSPMKSDVDDLPKTKIATQKKAYAIVIGIEQYRQKLPKAEYATSDAQVVSAYLTNVLGYPEENVITLFNEHATKSDFEKYIEKWLANNVEKDSTVFVYYSGHGAPDPKSGSAYLVPYDGDPAFIDETGYSLKRMYDALGKLPAKEIIVALDSCFSGAGGRSVIAKGSRPLMMNLKSTIAVPQNMTVMSASAGDQTSSTYDSKGHGLFTYFMLKGIKNEDVTRPDGSLEIKDLFNYIKPQVERIARKKYNNEQTPQLIEGKR